MNVLKQPFLNIVFKAILIGTLLFWGVWGIEWLIPHVVDLQKIKGEIETTVAKDVFKDFFEEEGWTLSIGKLEVKLRGEGVFVRFLEVDILDPESKEIVSLEQGTATLRYWPMIIGGTPEVAKVTLSDLFLDLEKDPQLKFKNPKIKPEKIRKKPSKAIETKPKLVKKTTAPPILFKNTTLAIGNHHLVLGPWLSKKTGWQAEGKQIELQHIESSMPLELAIDSQILANTKAKAPHPLGQLNLQLRIPQKTIQHPEKIEPDPMALERLNIRLQDISLAHWEWLLNQYSLPFKGKGHVDAIEFSYTHEGSQKRIKESFRLLAHALSPNDFSVQGYAFSLAPGEAVIQTNLIDRQFFDAFETRIESTPYRFKSSGTLRLAAPLFSKTETQNTFLKESEADLTIETTMLPLSLLRVLPDSSPLGQLFEQSDGLIQVNTRLTGLVESPSIEGNLQLEDISFTHQKLDLNTWELTDGGLQHLYGKVQFDKELIRLNQLEGELNGTPFQLNGTYHRQKNTLNSGVFKSGHFDLNDLRLTLLHFSSIFKLPLPDELKKIEFEGALNVDLKIKGLLSSPQVEGLLRLQDLGLHPFRHPEQKIIHQIHSVLRFEKDQLFFSETSGKLGDERFNLSGNYNAKKQALNLVMKSHSSKMSGLSKSLKSLAKILKTQPILKAMDSLTFGGTLDTELNIKGTLSKPDVAGHIDLKNISMADSKTALGVQNIQGKIQIHPQGIQLKNIRGNLEEIEFQLDGGLSGENIESLSHYKIHGLSHKVNLETVGHLLEKIPALKAMETFNSL